MGLLRQYSDHVQFSFVLHQTGHGIGREYACSQGQIGVDDCGELSEAGVSDGWVKTGPEHPQKDRSCRWENLLYPRHAHYIILFVFRLLFVHEVDTGEVIVVLAMQMLQSQVCPLGGRSHTRSQFKQPILAVQKWRQNTSHVPHINRSTA